MKTDASRTPSESSGRATPIDANGGDNGFWAKAERWSRRILVSGLIQKGLWILLAFGLAAPILVKMSVVVDLEGIRWAEASEVPEPLRQRFALLEQVLMPLGYRPLGWVRSEITPGSIVFVGALFLETSPRSAGVIGAFRPVTESGETTLKSTMTAMEMTTRLAGGLRLSTSTSPWPKSFEPRPDRVQSFHPEILDPLELLTVHRQEIAQAGPEAEPLAHRDLVAETIQESRLEFEAQVDQGLMVLSSEKRRYELTWKGAFIMTWRQVAHVLFSNEDDETAPNRRPKT